MGPDTRPFAVITGASTGIGLELAREFVTGGYDVLVAAEDDRIAQVPAQLAGEAGADGRVEAVQVDLAQDGGVERLWAAATAGGRVVDAVALHAGVGVGGEFVDTPLGDEQRMIALNVQSVVHLAKLAASHMSARGGGKLLFTSSLAARVPAPYQAVYGATKAFVQSLAQSLRQELDQRGITVTAFLPGPTDTEFFERAGMEDTAMAHSSAKDDPATVARQAFEAFRAGKDHAVTGSVGTKLQGALANVTPNAPLAKAQGKLAAPGSAD
ncbi:SDR family NAD(P)-dependent oxidoreductase [Kineococcus aurantiacus]|uniref:Short-subunit dehydrogenase n=1 Tax=Kineococcus aurantiacus TaxID=37633 RepID=A0A7Y9DLT2_9ACTN|nr:SDR family NAD(P)-dependent oxidoreductase [Kineococcus aurantiacus]NYD22946.1 short-subunit dehydrogenase [Kineococcus aurantiacus]